MGHLWGTSLTLLGTYGVPLRDILGISGDLQGIFGDISDTWGTYGAVVVDI